MTCPDCRHIHLGRVRCFWRESRQSKDICECESGALSATKGASTMLDLLVTNAGVKATKIAGECESIVTLVGANIARAHELLACVGEEIRISTASGSRKMLATLLSVQVKGKDGTPVIRARAKGGRDLDGLVGHAVSIEAAQMRIGTPHAVVTSSFPGAETCGDCKHPKNTRPRGKKKNGHGGASGSCVCGCAEFVAPARAAEA